MLTDLGPADTDFLPGVLRNGLEAMRARYYDFDQPVVTDAEYDVVVNRVARLEARRDDGARLSFDRQAELMRVLLDGMAGQHRRTESALREAPLAEVRSERGPWAGYRPIYGPGSGYYQTAMRVACRIERGIEARLARATDPVEVPGTAPGSAPAGIARRDH